MNAREIGKVIVPRRLRRVGRLIQSEAPIRLRDLIGGLASGQPELPPARLRLRVSRTSSRVEFLSVGWASARSVLEAARSDGLDTRAARILDFGCGCGRVARPVIELEPEADFVGIDVDRDAIAWCATHLRGRFINVSPDPPTPLPAGGFSLIYAVSVFTHLDERAQDGWLAELNRLLKPGGLLITSTHGPVLTFERRDLSEAQHRTLKERGFLFAPGARGSKEDSTFHSIEYLRERWSKWFEFRSHEQHGLAGYQDTSVWRRRA